eukprot:4633942-Amphidinium_carterae.1
MAKVVASLETVLCDDQDLPDLDKHLLGFALFLLHCRARYSDGLRPTAEPVLDEAPGANGFISTTTLVTKTLKAKVFKNRAFELVGFSCGVSGKPWARKWLECRAKLGLDVAQQGLLNPLREQGGAWSKRS